MSNDKNLQNILDQLKSHEKRIRALEERNSTTVKTTSDQRTPKQMTLAEMIRGKKYKSGQEKVAVIVGYYEKLERKDQIRNSDVKEGWKIGKFDGRYNPNLLARAIKDGLVRNIDGNLDLSQTGEKFFDNLLKPNNGSS